MINLVYVAVAPPTPRQEHSPPNRALSDLLDVENLLYVNDLQSAQLRLVHSKGLSTRTQWLCREAPKALLDPLVKDELLKSFDERRMRVMVGFNPVMGGLLSCARDDRLQKQIFEHDLRSQNHIISEYGLAAWQQIARAQGKKNPFLSLTLSSSAALRCVLRLLCASPDPSDKHREFLNDFLCHRMGLLDDPLFILQSVLPGDSLAYDVMNSCEGKTGEMDCGHLRPFAQPIPAPAAFELRSSSELLLQLRIPLAQGNLLFSAKATVFLIQLFELTKVFTCVLQAFDKVLPAARNTSVNPEGMAVALGQGLLSPKNFMRVAAETFVVHRLATLAPALLSLGAELSRAAETLTDVVEAEGPLDYAFRHWVHHAKLPADVEVSGEDGSCWTEGEETDSSERLFRGHIEDSVLFFNFL